MSSACNVLRRLAKTVRIPSDDRSVCAGRLARGSSPRCARREGCLAACGGSDLTCGAVRIRGSPRVVFRRWDAGANPPPCSSLRNVVRRSAKTVRIPPASRCRTRTQRCGLSSDFAEREGFEPSVRLPAHMISNHAPSATRSPLLAGPTAAREAGPSLCQREEREQNIEITVRWLDAALAGGESGIRTHGTLTRTPDFESGTFGRSVISPPRTMAASVRSVNEPNVERKR